MLFVSLRRLSTATLFAAFCLSCGADADDAEGDDGPPAGGKADDYEPTGFGCGGWERVAVDTVDEICVGIVAASNATGFKPRVLVEIPGRNNEFLITDLGNWAAERGQIWYLDATNPPNAEMNPVLGGLTLPHQIVAGADGWIYFGEDSRISAFPAEAIAADGQIDPSKVVTVLDGFPPMDRDGERNSMHPLTHFVFDDNGNLYASVGAYTDHCDDFVGRECHETDALLDDGDGSPDPRNWGAVIRRYDRIGDREWNPDYRIVAQGLRNSMGLVFTPGGDLVQVENGRDFPDSGRPFEELNVIPRAELEGDDPPRHYGWPYCYDAFETSDEWADFEGFRCSPDNPEYRPPHILLPPHGAPLGLTYYQGAVFEELQGQLIVPLHGYRPPGQRLLAFPVGDDGLPIRTEGATFLENPTGSGTSVEQPYPPSPFGTFSAVAGYLIHGWYAVAGARPKGAPVAPYVSVDGGLWIADDKNGAIMRLDRADGLLPPLGKEDLYPAFRRALDEDEELRTLYQAVVDTVLHAEQCMGCHDDFQLFNDSARYPELKYLLALGNWIVPGNLELSALFTKLRPVGEASMPPLGREWDDDAQGNAALKAIEDFVLAMPELSPGFNDGWIGAECMPGRDTDCGYEGGRCTDAGFCTLGCTLASPFCPDRTGQAQTFCIDIGGGVGGCVAKCDPAAPACLSGQSCVDRPRFGQTGTSPVCQ